MTDLERLTALKMVDGLEAQVMDLVKTLGSSREWSLAITKMEESAMWMRRAIERS